MRKTARPVVWEGAEAQSSALDPIVAFVGFFIARRRASASFPASRFARNQVPLPGMTPYGAEDSTPARMPFPWISSNRNWSLTSTDWEAVRAAQGGDGAALERVCRKYIYPIYAFFRTQGKPQPE